MQTEDIPVVILAGGKGMRLREYTEFMPKGLVPIGSIPVILHVMKIYAHYGFKKFILCLGYKGEMLKEYPFPNFEIAFVDTGLETNTGGRIKRIEKYIDTENFFANYCDGLADIDLHKLLSHHLKKNKIATVTGINPMSSFGILEVQDGLAISFKEKPKLSGIINGGYFVFNKKIFDYLDDSSILEEEPLKQLVSERQLAVYTHNGFWQCMDTYKDFERLNKLWGTDKLPHFDVNYAKPPWKIWE